MDADAGHSVQGYGSWDAATLGLPTPPCTDYIRSEYVPRYLMSELLPLCGRAGEPSTVLDGLVGEHTSLPFRFDSSINAISVHIVSIV